MSIEVRPTTISPVTWNSPLTVSFTGGQFQVSLANADFFCEDGPGSNDCAAEYPGGSFNGANIQATIKLLSLSTTAPADTSASEPASIVLLGTGLAFGAPAPETEALISDAVEGPAATSACPLSPGSHVPARSPASTSARHEDSRPVRHSKGIPHRAPGPLAHCAGQRFRKASASPRTVHR
jgi:hypothetical protein